MRRLSGFLDGDIQYALGLLDNKIETLQAYMALMAPEAPATSHWKAGHEPEQRIR